MSDVDPSIPLSVKPVQLDNPMDVQASAYKLKQLGIQTQQAQQDYQDSQTLRSIYAKNVDPTTGQLNQAGFARDGYAAGVGAKVQPVLGQFLANNKTQAETAKDNADAASASASAASSQYKLQDDKLTDVNNRIYSLLSKPNLGRQDAIDAVNQLTDQHRLDPAARDQMLATIPQNAADLRPWLVQKGLETQNVQQQLATQQATAPKIEYKDAGGKLVGVNTNPLSPGYAPPASIQKTVSPDTQATIDKDLTVSANKLSANGFSSAQGDVLGSLAAHGISLPAGLRSKEQIRSTVQALIDAHPDKSPDDIAEMVGNGQINFNSDKKAATVAAGQEGKLSTAVNELGPAGDLVMKYSALVPRGNFVPANKLMQMADSSISDPNLIRLKAGLTQLHNAYNVVGGRGGSDAAARHHIDDLFASANGPEGMQALVDAIKNEGDIAKTAAAQASHVGNTPDASSASGARPPLSAFESK